MFHTVNCEYLLWGNNWIAWLQWILVCLTFSKDYDNASNSNIFMWNVNLWKKVSSMRYLFEVTNVRENMQKYSSQFDVLLYEMV